MKQSDMEHFEWPVCVEEYEWKLGVESPGDSPVWFLSESDIGGGYQGSYTRYYPLEESGLFRTFAHTEPTHVGIGLFADKYGLLGNPLTVQFLGKDEEDSFESYDGERLDAWVKEIESMKRAVSLWDLVRLGDTSQIAALLNLDMPPKRTQGSIHTQWRQHAITAAQREILGELNSRFDRLVRKHGIVDEQGSIRLVDAPSSLLGALWFQFGQSMQENKDFEKCRVCGKWFEIHGRDTRTSKTYCSDACRFKAYRGRQGKALQLHSEGLSVEEIAEQIGADATAIQGWIARGRKR